MRVLDKLLMSPIAGITGDNGSGKTLLGVAGALRVMDSGQRVFSTVEIDHPECVLIRSVSDLLDARNGVVFLDEISSIFSSRASQSIPPELVILLQTLRKRSLRCWWTAPDFRRADVILREVTTTQYDLAPLVRGRVKEELGGWRPTVLSRWRAFDRRGYAEDSADSKLPSVGSGLIRLSRLQHAQEAYDTLAESPRLSGLAVAGACPDCGGRRPVHACSPQIHARLGMRPPNSSLDILSHTVTNRDTTVDTND